MLDIEPVPEELLEAQEISQEKLEDIVISVFNEYVNQGDVCAAEYLAWRKVPEGLSFEDAFHVYVEVMKRVEGDVFRVTKEGKTETL